MESIENKFLVRKAVKLDRDAILEVDKTTGNHYPNLESKLEEMVEAPGAYFLVALFDDSVVGYAGGFVRHSEFGEADPVGYITHIALKADFARKGMGKLLADKLIDAMSDDCDRIRTLLDFKHIDLQTYFNLMGFRKTDIMVYEFGKARDLIYP